MFIENKPAISEWLFIQLVITLRGATFFARFDSGHSQGK